MKEVRPMLALLLILCVVSATECRTDGAEDRDTDPEDWDTDSSEEYDIAEDTCMGDMEGIMIDGHDCPKHVEKHPTTCYNAHIYAVCCHSCDIFYLENEDSRPGCEYGDHDQDATFKDDLDGTNFTCTDVATTKGHACSQDDVSNVCCASCHQVEQQVSGEVIPEKIQEIFDHDEEDFDN